MSLLESLGKMAIKRKSAVLVVAVCVSVGIGAFIPRLDRQFNMITYFPKDSSVRKSDEMMKTKLGGNVPIWVTVEGDIKDPYVLTMMYTVEKYLRHFSDVSNVRSVAGIIAEMNHVMTGNLAIPDTTEGVGNLWFNLEGKEVLSQFVDKSRTHALIQGVCKSSDTARLRVIVAKMDEFLKELPQAATRFKIASLDCKKKSCADARINQVAWNIVLDLSHRLPGESFSRQDVHDWLQSASIHTPRLSKSELYFDSIRKYLDSDEVDLEIDDPEIKDSLAQAMAETAASGDMSQESLDKLVRKIVPETTIEQDKEGVGFLAKSMLVIIQQKNADLKLDRLMAAVFEHLPKKAKSDSSLGDELRGDLWLLSTATSWVPALGGSKFKGKLEKAKFEQTGMHHISVNVDNRLVFSQLSSLGLAALLAMLLLMIQFRSFLAGLLGMIPMVMTLLINFGTMAILGIDLDSSTVLIASLVVGVGIDYTIHFMSRTRLEMMKNAEPASAIMVAQRTSGRAIMINAVTVTAGQLVFLAGEMIPLHYFGALLSLAMVTSALASVTVMPAVLVATRPRFLTNSSRAAHDL